MKKNNKICNTCSSVYTYCPSCSAFDNYPTWMIMWCSENCKNIYFTASSFLANEISPAEAQRRFSEADLSKKDLFKDAIKKAINISMPQEKAIVATQEETAEKVQKKAKSSVKIKTRAEVENLNSD